MKLRTPLLVIVALLGATACNVDNDGDGYFAHVDCDDTVATIYPDADELCDGLDNDCNGIVDDNTIDAPVFFADFDRDSFGDPENTTSDCRFDSTNNAIDPTFQPYGFVTNSDDCNDTLKTVNPKAEELCDTIDNDCDGDIDEDDAINKSTFYRDADGDLFGDSEDTKDACDAPDGYVGNDDDCNDGSKDSNPGASEMCDGDDNDCDGEVDEDDALDAKPYYEDADGDTYGNKSSAVFACAQPEGYIEDDTDCNDDAKTANPAGTEVCDGLDNDCDPSTSEEGLIALNWGTTVYETIQGAIDASAAGDTVSVCAGEYTEDLYMGEPITLEGPGGSAVTTITGSGEGSVVFLKSGSTEGDYTITGLTISGGFAEVGGGIDAEDVDVFVGEDLVITGNSAEYGGGLSAWNATLTDVDLIDNEAEIGGGAFITSGTFDRVRFIDNMAFAGGGLGVSGGVLDAKNTRIISNYASAGAAGVYMIDAAEVSGITVLNNLTDGVAAGIYIEDGGVLSDSEVSRNRASTYGGGIIVDSATDIDNTTVSGNKAPDGAGIYATGDLTLDTCIVEKNTATANGGGIYINEGAGVTILKGSIIGNIAKAGGGVYIEAGDLDVTSAEFGSGTDENDPDDVYVGDGEIGYSSYGSGSTFLCDEDTCI